MKEKKVVLSHSDVFLREDGIVEVVFRKNSGITIVSCEELMLAHDQLLENKKYPILYVIGDYTTFTEEARSFFASERGLQYSIAEAYVFTSLAHKILGNFYLKMDKPRVTTKFFRKRKEAEAWLANYL